jgi:hypothetical protein
MASHIVKTGSFERKCLNYRGFLEKRDAPDLQDFVQRMFHLQFLANDGHQYIDANRNPDLRLHGVRRSPIKRLDSQMLLDPSKEQFRLPTIMPPKRGNYIGPPRAATQPLAEGRCCPSLTPRHRPWAWSIAQKHVPQTSRAGRSGSDSFGPARRRRPRSPSGRPVS